MKIKTIILSSLLALSCPRQPDTIGLSGKWEFSTVEVHPTQIQQLINPNT